MDLSPLTKKTLPALLSRSLSTFPDLPSLGFAGEKTATYKELGEKIDRIATYLQNKGVGQGDRVAILSENGPNWGAAYFAITSIKSIVVPILNDFHPSEIHHILRHSGAGALFVSERLYHKVEEFDLNSLSAVILIDNLSVISPDWSRDRLRRLYAEGSRELKRIKHMALQKAGLSSATADEDDPASIIYTSGTTGHSKAVVLTHGNITGNALSTNRMIQINHNDRMLSILPLPHVYECTLGLVLPLMIGASVFYVRKPPTAAVLVPALKEVRPTVMLSVPLIIEKMYKARILPEIRKKFVLRTAYKVPLLRKAINRKAGEKLKQTFGGSLHTFCIGGAGIAPDVEKFLREARFPYAIGYGLTETSPLVTGTPPSTARLYSAGKPLHDVMVRIDNENRRGDDGEILVKSPGIMKEYYKDPDLTAETITEDGWLHTGDLGHIDKDGYLYIRGRLKNMILGPSGENIYPEAIESVLHRSEYVLESLVFQQNGRLVARVHLNYEKLDEELTGQNLNQSQVREHIKTLLVSIREETNANVSSYSRLSEVIEQPEPFEKTPTQKIKRYLYASGE